MEIEYRDYLAEFVKELKKEQFNEKSRGKGYDAEGRSYDIILPEKTTPAVKPMRTLLYRHCKLIPDCDIHQRRTGIWMRKTHLRQVMR